MQHLTYLKNISTSPKKLRFMLSEIKKLRPAQSLERLIYAKEKSGKVLYQAIKSAINNASSALKCGPDLLKFKLLTIEQGQKQKRYQAGSRGTAKPIIHRFSHIKIVLETEDKVDSSAVQSSGLTEKKDEKIDTSVVGPEEKNEKKPIKASKKPTKVKKSK